MFDDAVELSSLLNLTLTKRGSFEQEDVKLCGIQESAEIHTFSSF